MAKIDKIEQLTKNHYLSMYHLHGVNSKGHESDYMIASRSPDADGLKIRTRKDSADGVVIYSLYGEKRDRVVLIRQYRYPVDDFVYELPAGLVEDGEDFHTAAARELHEETGLTFSPIHAPEEFEHPRFTSVGMTDEACGTVYGYAEGKISDRFMEEAEEIQVVLADRAEVRRILREERVALICAYHMMHFLYDPDPFAFLGVSH